MKPNSRSLRIKRIIAARRRDLAQSLGQHLTDDRNDPALRSGVDSAPSPMADKYLVLSEEERAKGFVRPVRQSYIHVGTPDGSTRGCGTVTRMGSALAETYARQPSFYGATYCAGCHMHRPVGPNGEFLWDGTDERVGT